MQPTAERAQALFRSGRYVELVNAHTGDVSALPSEQRVLLAHALLKSGQIQDAFRLAEGELRQDGSGALRSHCELIKALAYRYNARIETALHHHHLAIQCARDQRDGSQSAWANLKLFRLLAELRASDELAPMLTTVRRAATRSGDPHCISYLHYSVALMEASNGRVQEARRHLAIARSLLDAFPNAWLDQLTSVGAFFLDFLEARFVDALKHLRYARSLLEIVGNRERGVIDCNFGHVLLAMGRYRAAESQFRHVIKYDAGLARLGAMEGLARVFLATGKLQECRVALDDHDALLARDEQLASAFTGRWTGITRVRLLLAGGAFAEAAAECQRFLERAHELNDGLLTCELTCAMAEALAGLGRATEASRLLATFDPRQPRAAAGSLAVYYRTLGTTLSGTDAILGSAMHQRAERIDGVHRRSMHPTREPRGDACRSVADANAALLLNTVSSTVMLAHNPHLLGLELVDALRGLSCHAAIIESESPDAVAVPSTTTRQLLLGSSGKSYFHIAYSVPDNPILVTMAGDLLRVAAAAVALNRESQDARNRAALWPAEPVEEQAGALFVAEEMKALLATARRVAPTTVPVLITGETGTGKEVLARTIHAYSTRAKATFAAFNCTSTPRDMLDSQLFGHRRGAFTGALEHFPGVIRAAAGGTLFLDEIGDMPLDVQPKLLRFLEAGEVHPLGETQPVRADVRVIAATNASLDTLVGDGRFREDLFYRLNIVRLHIPPLRERRVEIPSLANHYLHKYAIECGKGDLRLAEETMEYLVLYRWPGNVRQLANEMRRMAALCEAGAVLMPEHLSPEIAASRRTIPASERVLDPTEIVVRLDQPMSAATDHLHRAMVRYALKQCHGRMEETAAMLGLSRKGLYLKRQRFGLDAPGGAVLGSV